MRVAGPDEPALEEDRDEDGRAFLELVEVHVGAVLPRPERGDRRHRIVSPALARRRVVGVDADGEGAGERLEVDRDAGLELGLALVPVQIEVLDEAFGKLGGQRADRGEVLARKVEVNPKGLGRDLKMRISITSPGSAPLT